MTTESYWDPFSVNSWAKLLGLTHENLFGNSAQHDGQHSVLLDGRAASFEFSRVDNPYFDGDEALSWSWSANMRHCVIANEMRHRLFVRRWDSPSEIQQFQMPTRNGAQKLLRMLHNSKSPRTPDVITWTLELFRYLIADLEDPSLSLSVLNAVLKLSRDSLLTKVSFNVNESDLPREVLDLLPMGTAEILDGHIDMRLQAAVSFSLRYLSEGLDRFGLKFRADLLFRHAASQLYQYAHLLIERDTQRYLPGLAPEPVFIGGPKEVRYTPNNLARSLVQQGLNALISDNSVASLDVFDPACGSGIFLQECMRECESRKIERQIHLRGADVSQLAVQISDACLRMAISEANSPKLFRPNFNQADSLRSEWPKCDLILMNPPFCSWQNMPEADREEVASVVGGHAGRADKAMAFVWKAVQALRPGGVMAAVMPRALLDNQSAADMRSEVGKIADIVLLGRFEGFSYFEHSLVETSFLILRKRVEAKPSTDVRIVIAEKGWEDASLRILRGASPTVEEMENVEIFDVRPDFFSASNWMPRRMSEMRLLGELEDRDFPSIQSLFDVQQGIRTGNKNAFLLSLDEVATLPSGERKYFRKAAGQGTIAQGKLIPNEFVFYPYDPRGPLFDDEVVLRKKLPSYFERWLQPLEDKLRGRRWAPKWWLPERPRQWQYEHRQKIISTYFGKPGAFAYDDEGDYVVVEGFAWNWVSGDIVLTSGDSAQFYDTLLPYAYLSILNSEVFEKIIACYSWRLQGGQLRLERRFLQKVPIPNMALDKQISVSCLQKLIEAGHAIRNGELKNVMTLINELTAETYRLPYSLFMPKERLNAQIDD